MQYQVHVKTELGQDDSIVVNAESEREAVHAAYEQHDSIADVIGAYLVEEPEVADSRQSGQCDWTFRDLTQCPESAQFAYLDDDAAQAQNAFCGPHAALSGLGDSSEQWRDLKANDDDLTSELHEANMSEVDMASWDNSAFYRKVADLEKNDPEISKLSDQIRAAYEAGLDTDDLNREFDREIEKKLGRKNERGAVQSADEVTAATYTPAEELWAEQALSSFRKAETVAGPEAAGDDISRDPNPNVSWGPDGDRRMWDETSRSWVTDPDWDGVRFDDDLAETSHAVARAREALAELNSHQEGAEEKWAPHGRSGSYVDQDPRETSRAVSRAREVVRNVVDGTVNTVLGVAEAPRRAFDQYQRDMYTHGQSMRGVRREMRKQAREDRAEEQRGRWLSDVTDRGAARQGETGVR